MRCNLQHLLAIILAGCTVVAFAPGAVAVEKPQHDGMAPIAPTDPRGPYEITWVTPKVESYNSYSKATFSSDGKRLCVVCYGETQVWDTATWKPVGATIAFGDWVCDAAFDAAGKRVMMVREVMEYREGSQPALATVDMQWRVWDVETGKPTGPAVLHENKGRERFTANGAALSPCGQFVAVRDGPMMELWNVETGKVERSFKHENWPKAWRFTTDGKSLIVVEGDGRANVWEVESGRLRSKQDLTSGGFLFEMELVDSHMLLRRSGFKLLDIESGRNVWSFSDLYMESLSGMHISASGNRLAFETHNQTEIWDVDTGRRRATIMANSVVALDAQCSTLVMSVWTGKEGDDAFASSIWSGETGKKVRDIGPWLDRAAFSPEGNLLAAIRKRMVRVIHADPKKQGAQRWKVEEKK